MTSEPKQAFVWVWLPGATDPVVAGRLDAIGEIVTFTYGRSYLDRDGAIPLRSRFISPSCHSAAGRSPRSPARSPDASLTRRQMHGVGE